MLAPDGSLSSSFAVADGETTYAADAFALRNLSYGGADYLLSASQTEQGITAFHINPDGLVATDSIGIEEGLGIMTPTAMEVVEYGGRSFVLLASSPSDGIGQSGAISVLELGPDGSLHATDHVIDTLDTRFGNLQSLEVVQTDTKVYVIAGGGDDGVTLFTLLPNGRLQLLDVMPDSHDTGLQNVSAMAAYHTNDALHVFVAPEIEAGVTELEIDIASEGLTFMASAAGDSLTATALDDVVVGDSGDDVLLGMAGDDLIEDGAGRDTLTGGAGRDTFILRSDSDHDIITDFEPGLDKIDLSGWPMFYGPLQLSVLATSTGAVITFRGEILEIHTIDGRSLSYADVAAALVAAPNRSPNIEDIDGNANDALVLIGTSGNDSLAGGIGDDLIDGGVGLDYLEGNNGNDRILGGDGDDTLIGGWGRDTLEGGSGNDQLSGSNDHDVINGDAGQDTLLGGNGGDTIQGGDDNDTIYGNGGFDQIYGGDGDDLAYGDDHADYIYGGNGNDTVYGGSGNDNLRGDSGNDTIWGELGRDTINGGEGNDHLIGGSDRDRLYGDMGNDTLEGGTGFDWLGGLDGDDLIYGGNHADNLLGQLGNDTLWGGGGNDRLFGGFGDDFVYGGDGNDVFFLHAGHDYAEGGDGYDRLSGSAGWDTLFGGDGNDDLRGGTQNDQLYGDAGNDTLYGGSEDDSLSGGQGADLLVDDRGDDTLWGGEDDDIFFFGNWHGIDRIEDFETGPGGDRIDFSGHSVFVDIDFVFGPSGAASQVGADVYIATSGLSGIWIIDTVLSDLMVEDFIF